MNDLKPFRFWCQKVLPLVYDDSLSYYELLCKVIHYLNKTIENVNELGENFVELQQMFNTLKQYVDNYFKNLDVQEEINKKLDEMSKNGELDYILNNLLLENSTEIINGNSVFDYFHSYNDWDSVNGGCYIGNNNIVIYLSGVNSNIGKLMCINLSTLAINWETSIDCGHGNTLTYNPDNNCLYITYCFSYETPTELSNVISVIDLSNHNVIKNTIQLIEPSYSLVYDPIKNKYYNISSRGYENGVANKVSVFNINFEKESEFLIKDYQAVKTLTSVQGLSYAYNGVLCVIGYSSNNRSVLLCNDKGETLLYKHIENFFNGYRAVGESEFLTYDFDNNKYYFGYSRFNTGFGGHKMESVAELNVTKNITYPKFEIAPPDLTMGQFISLSFNHSEGIKKAINPINNAICNCIDDCFNVSYLNSVLVYINASQNIGNYISPPSKIKIIGDENTEVKVSSIDGYSLEYLECDNLHFTGNVQINSALNNYSMYCTPNQTRILNNCVLDKPFYVDRGNMHIKNCTYNFNGFNKAITHSKVTIDKGKLECNDTNILQNAYPIKTFTHNKVNTFDLSDVIGDDSNVITLGVSLSNSNYPVVCKPRGNTKNNIVIHAYDGTTPFDIYAFVSYENKTITFSEVHTFMNGVWQSRDYIWGTTFYLMP